MYHSSDKNDPDVREAIWQVYDRRCAYCKQYIKLKELDIDHIIPENPKKWADEYFGAAEPQFRCGVSHLSGTTEPPTFFIIHCSFYLSHIPHAWKYL